MNFYSLGWFFAVGAWYFEELLNPLAIAHSSVPPAEPILDDFFLDLPMYAPTHQGIRKALSWFRNHKASGIDQVSNEELGCGGEASLDLLTPLFEKVWNIEEVPSDWLKGVITKIEKKGDWSYYENNRGITLRWTASKLFQMIIITRMSDGIESLLRENQCGFRKGRSYTDQLFTLES